MLTLKPANEEFIIVIALKEQLLIARMFLQPYLI
jgi:hypothetical protein